MKLPVYDIRGEVIGERELPENLFAVEFVPALVSQAVRRQWWNAKPPSAHTKTRAEVRGGGRKPWPQKHTGRARQGSIRAPQWVGGGVVHGPRPGVRRTLRMNKKMRRKALFGTLSRVTQDGNLLLLQDPDLERPKTKQGRELLKNLGLEEHKVLFFLESEEEPLALSLRNLPRVKVLRADRLNVLDLLEHDKVVLTLKALDIIEQIWGNWNGKAH